MAYTIEPGVFKKFCEKARGLDSSEGGSDSLLKENPTVWVVLLGGTKKADLKDYCFSHDEIRIGWRDWEEVITEETEKLNDKSRAVISVWNHPFLDIVE